MPQAVLLELLTATGVYALAVTSVIHRHCEERSDVAPKDEVRGSALGVQSVSFYTVSSVIFVIASSKGIPLEIAAFRAALTLWMTCIRLPVRL